MSSMRREYRPPIGMPERRRRRWQGWIVSLLAHLLFFALILLPALHSDWNLQHAEGAGGLRPAGGGGGGSSGGASGAQHGRLQFVALNAPNGVTRPVVQPPAPVVKPPPPPPASQPVIVPPVPPAPQPVPPTQASAPAASPSSGDVGSAGTGAAGTGGAGVGTGTGGGTGSGEGSGRGSGVGSGTGGGNAQIYPPTPRQFFLPPLPAPRALRGFRLIAWFDVDSTGKASLLRFTPSPDNDYNKRLRETLLGMRFRPAVRPDGVPVRDTADVQFLF
jgi:protein TonB